MLWGLPIRRNPDGRAPTTPRGRRGSIEVLQVSDQSPTVSEARLLSVLDTAVDGIVVIDDRARVLVFNKACEVLFGYGAASVVGRNISFLMPPEYSAEHDAAVGHYLKTGEKRIIGIGREVRARHADGTVFPIELSVGEARTPEGPQFIGILRDLRPRKAVEQRLNQLQAQLVQMARVNAMDEMGAAVAHELNQPLAAITSYNAGCLNKLESGHFTPGELKDALGKLGVQAQRAGSIIRRVHDFVRKSEPKLAPCDLAEVIDDSIGFIDAAARSLNVRIVRVIQGMRPELMADGVMIEQVLLNLMRNGIEAMSDTVPENRCLTIKLSQIDKHMEIRVVDRGPGILPEVQEKLFTPFFTTKAEGMGIGLNICRSIIEFHHGRLWVEDNPEGGTVFVFTLPITRP